MSKRAFFEPAAEVFAGHANDDSSYDLAAECDRDLGEHIDSRPKVRGGSRSLAVTESSPSITSTELSSIDGSESPHHLQAKVAAGKVSQVRTTAGAASAVLRIEGSFDKPYHDALVQRFSELRGLAVAHTMHLHNVGEVLVKNRPKLVYGNFGADGSAPLYLWGQVESDMCEIRPMPAWGEDFLAHIAKVHPQAAGNHLLLTFSEGMPGHHDKRFNKLTKQKQPTAPEVEAPLLLFNFGASCALDLTDGNTLVRRVEFNSGDFIFVPGWVNGRLKHSVEKLSEGQRTSVVVRMVDAHWVNVRHGFYMKNDKRIDVQGWVVKQPDLPEWLATALLGASEAQPTMTTLSSCFCSKTSTMTTVTTLMSGWLKKKTIMPPGSGPLWQLSIDFGLCPAGHSASRCF